MPRTTKEGTIHSDVYAGRVIVTLPAPGTMEAQQLEYIVATRNSVEGETVGIQVDRNPKQMPIDVFKRLEVTVVAEQGKVVKISGEAWLLAVPLFFEKSYDVMTVPGMMPPPGPAPSAPAPPAPPAITASKKRKRSK